MKSGLASILVFGFAAGIQAAAWYVAVTGSDSNPGTLSQPFATLHKAHTMASAGDTIYLRGGEYRYTSAIQLNKANRPDARIVIRSYPGEKAILDGTNSKGTMNGINDFDCDDAFLFRRASYYTIRDLEVRNVKRIAFNLYGGGATDTSHNIDIINCHVHGVFRGAVYGVRWSRKISVDSCRFHDCARINAGFAYNHSGGWPSIVNIDGPGSRVKDCEIFESWGEGIGCYGDSQTVIGNRLRDNYSVEIYVNNVRNSRVEGNYIYTLDKPAFYRRLGDYNTAAMGIETANEGPNDISFNNNIIINNIVVGTRRNHFFHWNGPGGGGLRNSVIAHNVFIGDAQASVFHIDNGSHTNTLIANNIIMKTGPTNPNWGRTLQSIAVNDGLNFRNNCWFGGQAGKGAGDGDLYVNPQFRDSAGLTPEDFRLKSGSPCIGKGIAVPAVTGDFAGVIRGNAVDIGAFVFSAMTFTREKMHCGSPSVSRNTLVGMYDGGFQVSAGKNVKSRYTIIGRRVR